MEKLVFVVLVVALCFFGFRRIRSIFETSYRLGRVEKLDKGWRGEVTAIHRGKEYPEVWVSEGGSCWYNVKTLGGISASNWGGGGDYLADLLSDEVDRQRVQDTVDRITREVR